MSRAARFVLVLLLAAGSAGWGRKGHEIVNREAVNAVPPELRPFYRRHARELVARAMQADLAKRGTGCEDVAHFVNLDRWGDPKSYPRSIDEGVRLHGLDAFLRAGLLPWRVRDVFDQLVEAWKAKDHAKVVELSAWIGHYAGDAHQPMHASANFDGQLTGQDGLHARYENDMVDAHDYDKLVPPLVRPAAEIADPFEATFAVALESLGHMETLLKADKEASAKEPLLKPGPDGKPPRRRSETYYREMNERLAALTADRLAKAATWAASLWWSAWIKAGRPAFD